MQVVFWLIAGGVVGWVAGLLMKRRDGAPQVRIRNAEEQHRHGGRRSQPDIDQGDDAVIATQLAADGVNDSQGMD